MKCEHCKQNEATCFYEINTNGNLRSYSLCADCAAKMNFDGIEPTNPFEGFGADINQLFGTLFGVPTAKVTPKSTKTCPTCGATWREITTCGKVLCADCYNTFREEIEPTLRSLHGAATHAGRAPLKQRASREKDVKLSELRAALSKAIGEENFEEAATLRDRIRALEKE